jgi:tetratricopeptide (TPR) repeat protein
VTDPLRSRPLLAPIVLLLALLSTPPGAEAKALDLGGTAFTGENSLGVKRAEFRYAQEGMELIYLRRYLEALQHFEVAGVEFPDSALGPLGRSLVYQSMMIENYDFQYEDPYRSEYSETSELLRIALRSGHDRSWTWFMYAVHLGIDAMYDVRRAEYVRALNKAWDAMEYIKKLSRREPQFHDAKLALGLYNYWRTAITESIPYLPRFGDHRELGLRQLREAREQGYLCSAPASIALTYSYIEGRKWAEATAEAEWARKRYPDNIINQMTLARVYRRQKQYDAALATFDRVLEIDPDNKRVHFHIGETWYKRRKGNKKARAAYERYLSTKPHPEFLAHTYYRLGLLERRARNYDAAIIWLQKSIDTWPRFKAAGKRLKEVLAEKKRKGSQRARSPKAKTAKTVHDRRAIPPS